jgi:hypothetical protein
MAELPYLNAYGNISRALKKIQEAATPPRFTLDFLSTKLALKGGSARPLIPFFKRTGFLGSDGIPTDLYKRFRNPSKQGKAAFEALRNGFGPLYEVNEYIHDASDQDLRGVVVQVTGLDADSTTVKSIVGSFKALKEFATFDGDSDEEEEPSTDEPSDTEEEPSENGVKRRIGLSYTINLNLPPTSDIAVFDAIFKSLKEHLLR